MHGLSMPESGRITLSVNVGADETHDQDTNHNPIGLFLPRFSLECKFATSYNRTPNKKKAGKEPPAIAR